MSDLFHGFLRAAAPEHADPVFVAAADTENATSGAASDKKNVGAPMDRVDGRLKVTGGARYAAEFSAPGIAHGVLLQSSIASGRIRSLDTTEAERAPGVIAVITYRNLPTMPRPSVPPAGESLPLLTPEIYYSGQNVAVVVAETFEQAEHAAALIQVDYVAQTPVVSLEAHLGDAFVPNTGNRPAASKRGDFATAAASAPVKVQQIYRTPIEHHNPMEPHGTVAVWSGNSLTVYDATQGVGNTAQNLAEQFGILPEDVHVIDPFVGGGFGCKGQSWAHTALDGGRGKSRRQARAAIADAAADVQLERTSAADAPGKRSGGDAGRKAGGACSTRPLRTPRATTNSWSRPAHPRQCCTRARTSMSGIGSSASTPVHRLTCAHQVSRAARSDLRPAMDELAVAAALDPIELRLRNYAEIDESTGHPWSSKSLRECYARGAERFGWSRRDPRPGSMRDGRWLIGSAWRLPRTPRTSVPRAPRR